MTSKPKKTKISNEFCLPQDLRDNIQQLVTDILEIGKDSEHSEDLQLQSVAKPYAKS